GGNFKAAAAATTPATTTACGRCAFGCRSTIGSRLIDGFYNFLLFQIDDSIFRFIDHITVRLLRDERSGPIEHFPVRAGGASLEPVVVSRVVQHEAARYLACRHID